MSARDVIDHMDALGVDVAPVPLLGDVCPMCGRRMPVAGRALEDGICDACHTRLMREMAGVRDAECAEARAADADGHRRRVPPSPRGYSDDGDYAYEEWRHRTDYR